MRVAESGDAGRAAGAARARVGRVDLHVARLVRAARRGGIPRAWRVDLPGHGLSDKPTDAGRYTPRPRWSASVREVIDDRAARGARTSSRSRWAATIALELAAGGEPRDRPAGAREPGVLRPRAPAAARAAREPDASWSRCSTRLVPRWVVARAHRLVYGDPSLHHRRTTSISTGRRRSSPATRARCDGCCTSSPGPRARLDVAARLRCRAGCCGARTRDRLVRDARRTCVLGARATARGDASAAAATR